MIWLVALMLSLSAKAEMAELPVNCFIKHQFPCAVRGLKSHRLINDKDVVFLKKQASMQLISERSYQLLDGEFLFDTKKEVTLSAAGKEFKIKGLVFVKFDSNKSKVIFENWKGVVSLSEKQLPVGFANWYSGDLMGVFNIFTEESVKKKLTNFKFFDAKKIDEKMIELNEVWQDRLDQSSKFYQDSVQRSVASINQRQKNIEQARLKKEQEKAHLRSLYKSKIFYGSDLD